MIRYKEWEEYREIDEWGSYEEYLQEKSENSQYGLKNKFGIRDDMTIHFLNFNKFKQKYKNIANDLLVLLNDVIHDQTNIFNIPLYKNGQIFYEHIWSNQYKGVIENIKIKEQ